MQGGKKKSWYVLNILLILGLSGLLLWISVKDDRQAIVSALRSAEPGWLVFLCLTTFAVRWLVGYCLTVYTRLTKPDYRQKQGLINSLTGCLFNYITPGASGGQFYQVYVFKHQGVDYPTAAGVLWMDFIVYQSVVVGVSLVLLLLRFHHFFTVYSQFFSLVLFGFAVNVLVIFLLWAMVHVPRCYHWITHTGMKICLRLHIVKDRDKAEDRLQKALRSFEKETKTLSGNKQILPGVILANVVRLLLYYATPYFCALALHIPVDKSMLVDILALSSFVAMINAFLPMPGSSGGTEAVFLLMFRTLFTSSQTSGIMILWRLTTYFFSILIGVAGFLYERTQPDLSREERKPSETDE